MISKAWIFFTNSPWILLKRLRAFIYPDYRSPISKKGLKFPILSEKFFPRKRNCCKSNSLPWWLDENKHFKEYECEWTILLFCTKRGTITQFVSRKQWLFFRKYVIEKHFSLFWVYDNTFKINSEIACKA